MSHTTNTQQANMANVNKVILIGNLTRDPEIRYTGNGTAVADVGLAVNRVYKVGEEKREETTFVDVTLWSRQAEIAAEYLKKGSPVYIEGRLQLDTWDDKTTGDKRSKLIVVGENLQLLGGKGEGSGDGGGGKSAGAKQTAKPTSGGKSASAKKTVVADADDDDIPF